MDGDPRRINRDVRGSLLSPTATVEILDSVALDAHRFVSMTAEDPLGVQRFAIRQSSGRHFAGKT